MQKKASIISSVFLIALFFSHLAFASSTPTLSLLPTGDGDSVTVTVTGDPSTNVVLYYVKTGSGQQIAPIGTTNTNGTLTTTVSTSTYNIAQASQVYVTVGGLNGLQSPSVAWPVASSMTSSNNMLTLSQTGLVLPVGQSTTLTASNINGGTLYLASNSTPAIANINISGNQVTVIANSYGSTTATVCLVSNRSNCSSVYVMVQNSNSQPLSFSQSSISLYSGQTASVQISGGTGSYVVSSNTGQNGGSIQTNISGSAITLTTASTTGSASVTVCSADLSSCGIINATVGSGSTNAITFSQSTPTVTIGQTTNVNVYGPTSSLLYVASNSNPSIVQANISGTTLALVGIASGSSTISVCASVSNCGTLTVTVTYNSGTAGGYPSLSQSSVTLSVGQTSTITISGGSMPYTISSSAPTIFQPILNVTTLSLYGVGAGSSSMNVCSASGNCATLSVVVAGQSSTSTTPATTSTATTTIPIGCYTTTLFSAVTGQACPNYVSAQVVPTTPTVTTETPQVMPTPTPSPSIVFTKLLKIGSTGEEVIALQRKLKTLGFYSGKIDGGFGAATQKAVKAFQKAHKLSQVGSVGPQTRAALNK